MLWSKGLDEGFLCLVLARQPPVGQGPLIQEVSTGSADKSLVRPGRKQATATEDFEFYISYL